MSQEHVQRHIELIAQHEEDFLAGRSTKERIGDAIAGFAGGLSFVSLHLVLFAGWLVWNSTSIAPGRHFDPAPYSLLGTLVALEALLLASFILMRQARVGRRAEERAHLMLQVLILTEKEITAVLELNRQIAKQIGLQDAANSKEMRELSKDTSIQDVAQTIRESMPSTND